MWMCCETSEEVELGLENSDQPKILRFVKNLCWDHKLKSQIYYIYQHRWTFILMSDTSLVCKLVLYREQWKSVLSTVESIYTVIILQRVQLKKFHFCTD